MMSLIIVCIGIIACVVLSGVFSASEMAISSCNTVRMENEAKDGNRRAARVIKLRSDYDNTLSTILLSNNLVNIAASSLGTVYIILMTGSDDLNWLVATVITVLIIVFGEAIPKMISKTHANSFSKGISGFLSALYYILWPVNFIVVFITGLITKPLSRDEGLTDDEEVVEELQAIIETAEDEGVIDSDRSEIVAAAIDFSAISTGTLPDVYRIHSDSSTPVFSAYPTALSTALCLPMSSHVNSISPRLPSMHECVHDVMS